MILLSRNLLPHLRHLSGERRDLSTNLFLKSMKILLFQMSSEWNMFSRPPLEGDMQHGNTFPPPSIVKKEKGILQSRSKVARS